MKVTGPEASNGSQCSLLPEVSNGFKWFIPGEMIQLGTGYGYGAMAMAAPWWWRSRSPGDSWNPSGKALAPVEPATRNGGLLDPMNHLNIYIYPHKETIWELYGKFETMETMETILSGNCSSRSNESLGTMHHVCHVPFLVQNGCIQMYDIVWQSIILANQENMGLYWPKDGEGCFFISPWHPCLHYKILHITRIEWDVYCINLRTLLLLLCTGEINSIFQNPDDPF